MTARTAVLAGIVAALVVAAMILLINHNPVQTRPDPVSCTAATSCVLPDQDIPSDNLDFPRE